MDNLFSGFLLVSDMDGTLISSEHTISEANIRALEEFCRRGGTFSVASGRMVDAAKVFSKYLPVNAPAIIHNGAKIYNLTTDETLYEVFIEEHRKNAVKTVARLFPEIGIEIYADECVYVYRSCEYTKRFLDKNYTVYYDTDDHVFEKQWVKVLYIADEHILDRFEEYYQKHIDTGYTVRSGANFLDMVSSEASKGEGLKRLIGYLKIDASSTAAVGDNMNDISMFEAAGYSFAVDNASDTVKNTADIIAPDCNSDALEFVVKTLEDILSV